MIINADEWQRPALDENAVIENQVRQMLAVIKNGGDSEIDQYARQFDNQNPERIPLKPFEDYPLDAELSQSIQQAAKRIEAFARFQMKGMQSRSFSDEFGSYSQNVSAIERVGAYIPGGRYPLISTALMTLIPARVAGSPVRIACSPSDHPAILAAASLAGATEFIQIGGVQAIAALAYGYQNIKPVDIIVGPGNAWVNEAKKQLQSRVKIDGLAGPSELLAICDSEQPVEWLALDALAQAEHDPLACSLLLSDNQKWLDKMLDYLQSKPQLAELLDKRQIDLVYAKTAEELVQFSEAYAPEHLMLCHKQVKQEQLSNYGSLFIGANSAVALGDYISGPNHTLPTLGFARQNGGLSVHNFLRVNTTQNINDTGRRALCKEAMPLAKAEGLEYHYQSLLVRAQADCDGW